jgi:outer membrane lipoprotein SlyB
MSRTRLLAILFVPGFVLGACTYPDGTPDNRATSALIGGAGGAMIGQAIGGDSRSTLIGAGAGAAAGALIGQDQTNQQRAIQQRQRVYY